MYKKIKQSYVLLALLISVLLSFSCYTHLGTAGVQTESDYSDYYSQDQSYEYEENQYRDHEVVDEHVLYQQYDHDLSLPYYDAPLLVDSYWYEPYWYYTMNSWWNPAYDSRYHFGFYDPFWNYYPPYYTRRPWSSFYFGFGYSSYYGYGYYSHWNYDPFYGPGGISNVRNYKRRSIPRSGVRVPDTRVRTVMTGAGPAVVTEASKQSNRSQDIQRSRTVSTTPRSDVVTIRKPLSTRSRSTSSTNIRTRSSSAPRSTYTRTRSSTPRSSETTVRSVDNKVRTNRSSAATRSRTYSRSRSSSSQPSSSSVRSSNSSRSRSYSRSSSSTSRSRSSSSSSRSSGSSNRSSSSSSSSSRSRSRR